MLSDIFHRFIKASPVTVMIRGLLERLLNPEQLDAWFARTAEKQYMQSVSAGDAWIADRNFSACTVKLKPPRPATILTSSHFTLEIVTWGLRHEEPGSVCADHDQANGGECCGG